MSRLRGRSQKRESQESCPEDPGAAFQGQHYGAAKARPRLVGLLLALVTLLVYLPVARHGFLVFDDGEYITENPAVQKGLTRAAIQWAFTTGHASNWHPLTWLSHMTDCELFGLNPGAHHVVNALFHAANAALLFALLLRLTGGLWPSAFVAALFAWHPLHVESVAWISERKDVLSTFFALLTLLVYTSYVSHKAGHATRRYVLCLLLFALGLMAKPMLVTLPFVMLLLDYWPLGRMSECGVRSADLKNISRPSTLNSDESRAGLQPSTLWRLALEKWPFFLLAAVSCVVTYVAQSRGDAVISWEIVPPGLRLENALTAYVRYLLKTVCPINLVVIYPLTPEINGFAVIAAVAVLVFISIIVWRARQRSPYGLFGWLWFLGTLVPVIGLVQVGGAALADRYTYFPLIGVFVAVTFGVCELANRRQYPKAAVGAAAGLVLAACLLLAENQLRYWRNSESLFRRALAVTRDNYLAHLNLGTVFQNEGRLNEALAEYREAARLFPGYFLVHSNLGSLLDDLGRPEEALAEYRLALQLKSNLPSLHDGTGIVLVELGHADEAMREFAEAARLDPAYPWPYFQMGKVLLGQGRDAEAIDKFREALRISPDNYQILAYAARVLAADENPQVRDGQTALAYAARANVLSDSALPFVLDALGMACAEAGRFDDAQEAVEKAMKIVTAAGIKQDVVSLQQRLRLYQNHQPWRESFLSTNARSGDLPPK